MQPRQRTLRTPRPVLGLLALLLGVALGCTGRKGTDVVPGNHSTYPHHSHDENGAPHPKSFGAPLPPPHNHHHGATWN